MVVVSHRISSDLLAILREQAIHTRTCAGGRGGVGSNIGIVVFVGHTSAGAEAMVILIVLKRG